MIFSKFDMLDFEGTYLGGTLINFASLEPRVGIEKIGDGDRRNS
jgi:hypothetical protein